jgi:thiol-disulfide isomerase/thioredoxin
MLREVADAPARAKVEYREGLALFALYFAQSEGRGGIDKDVKKAAATLKQADDVLVQGERDDAANEPLRMLHGRVLAALKRDEDAGREFEACAAAPGASAGECARAQHFEKNVALARNEPAPMFAAKTLDGKPVSLDLLAGKVVVMDFWATWCPVCVRDSDYVQSLEDSFGDDKRFVLLEVSGDEDDQAWRNYLDEHRLHGMQVRDATRQVSDAFHVGAFPTYVILDGNGSVRLRVVGSRGDLRGTVRDLLKEATPAAEPARTLLPKTGQ